ncbi:MAG: NAD-dependent epimerase/dehydratase family protein, partial [Planctomycetota bacterium]|nr:NAD-dependent epimerase/dehydratase family protein [Planctomycetota bacterium]
DPESHLIPNVLKVALGQKDQAQIFGDDYPTPDGTCLRDYIHIVDLAQAHILALRPGLAGAFNLGNGEGFSVKQVIETCRAVTGRAIPSSLAPRRAGDPARLVASSGKALSQLHWRPQFPDLATIVAHAWNWHKGHPRGYGDR